LKNELKIFLTALSFYTRIPVGHIAGWSEELLNKATRYFPLVGVLVGGFGAFVFWSFSFLFPTSIAILISMLATILLTGAFHEDGLADFCDGFGGGYTPEKILDIMKDSRVGTYGSIGLIAALGLKFFSLLHLDPARLPMILIVGHAVSRIFPVVLIYTSQYVRLDASSKAKPIGKSDSVSSFILAIVLGGYTLLFLGWMEIIISLSVLLVLTLLFRNYIQRKIGGYTGDILGALQQLCEVLFYGSLLAFQNWG
jgi:adenosylcobinamide-GDP ribazoletransferase